ncbi:Diphthamide biosynthesis protein 2 [Lodderomyces elongisporus]|uniref:Diphthamide biosynthesis protein 2 n=1 Tax=Lodderomyces elongisporus TaxID=36914 RepID=UPI002921D2B9|nr:Diphthamide biosynthesis protein 2 [Lodderomyces elongisporus]WLF80227.1 Diphthamide biosynthesis protein 2 [Lodderomyces elongisporus]
MQAPVLSTNSDYSYAKVQSSTKSRREDVVQYYALDKLAEKLAETETDTETDKDTSTSKGKPKFRHITLQFPDDLIADSASIVYYLQKKLNLNNSDSDQQKIWVLADTSYSACCVDEVAAEHVGSDLVVHFGDACLNDVAKLSAIYVLGKPSIDEEQVLSQFRSRYSKEDRVILMADAPHTYILSNLKQKLSNEYEQIEIADLKNANIVDYQPSSAEHMNFNRTLSVQEVSDYHLFHITVPEAPRLLQLTTNFASVTTYDPGNNQMSQGPFPNLMRRYKLVHVARSSGTIGILVNTLSLTNTKLLINTIKDRIKAAGKKHYIFVVGKPNVAKLANFESIDVWCILGCDHSGIVIDQNNEFYKPIITPYELLLGLSDELSWTGKWVTDYQSVIENYQEEITRGASNDDEEDNDGDASSDEEPEFDPVTGTFVSTSRPLRQLNHLTIQNDDSNELVKRSANAIAIRNTVSTSAMFLQQRQWTGLGSDLASNNDKSDEGSVLEEGRRGIARGYEFDTTQKKGAN